MHIGKVILIAAGVAVLGGLAATGTAVADEESTYNAVISKPATSYSSPSNQSTAIDTDLKPGTPVNARCVTEGQTLNGNRFWFRIDKDGQYIGYVHRDVISGAQGVTHC